jgi:HEAT repeat protein
LARLSALGKEASPAFHPLQSLAQSGGLSADEDIALMNALAAIGPAARPANELILKRLGHGSPSVSAAAKDALLKIGMDAASGRALLKLLMTKDSPLVSRNRYKESRELLRTLGRDAVDLMDDLRAGLQAKDRDLNEVCLDVLEQLGVDAAPALPELTGIIEDGVPYGYDAAFYRRVTTFLGSFGDKAVPALVKAMADDELAETARDALVRVGKPAVSTLIECIRSRDTDTRDAAVAAVAAIGPDAREAVPALMQSLKNEPVDSQYYIHTQFDITDCITAIGVDADQLPMLADFLIRHWKHLGAQEIYNYATFFEELVAPLGPKAVVILPQLRRGFKHNDYYVKTACIKVVAAMGPAAKEAVGDLAVLLRSDDIRSETKEAALSALGAMGESAAEALPSMLAQLEDFSVGEDAARALARVGPSAVPGLSKALSSDESGVNAAKSLGLMGAQAKPAVPYLIKALRGRRWDVSAGAAQALGQIEDDSPETVAALTSALYHNSGAVVDSAALSLGQMRSKAKASIPRLKELVQRDDRSSFAAAACLVRLGEKDLGMGYLVKKLKGRIARDMEASAQALAYLGPEGADAVESLVDALSTNNSFARPEIIMALEAVGPAAKPAVPALRALKDDEELVVKALAAIVPPATTDNSTAHLITLLKGADTGMRRYAASSLGETANEDAKAAAALYEGLRDSDSQVRLECLYALMRVDPDAEKKLMAYAAQIGPLIGAAASRCDDEGFVRWTRFAGGLGTSALPAMEDLHEAVLSRKSFQAGAALAEALADIGPDAVKPYMAARRVETNRDLCTGPMCAAWAARGKDGIPFLRAVLSHSHYDRYVAVGAMMPMGRDAAAAIPELIPLLEVESGFTARRTATVLGNIGSDEDRVMQALSKALGSDDRYLRADAALALGRIGSREKTKPMLPKLRKCLYSDESMEVCYAAGALLSLKDGEHCIDLLREQLKGRNPEYVTEACELAGPAAAELVPDLLSALKAIGPGYHQHYSSLEQGVLKALPKIGASADVLLPVLLDRLQKTRHTESRLMIIDMLRPSVSTSEQVKKALATVSRGEDSVAAKAAKEALVGAKR